MKKIRPIKNILFDWLVNYILEPIRISAGGSKEKGISIFNSNTSKHTVWERKETQKPKAQNKIRIPFVLKKKKKLSKSWAKSQKLPVNNFEWIEDTHFNEDFIKNYNQESDEGYFLEVDVQYPEKLLERHNDLPLLPERMKIE